MHISGEKLDIKSPSNFVVTTSIRLWEMLWSSLEYRLVMSTFMVSIHSRFKCIVVSIEKAFTLGRSYAQRFQGSYRHWFLGILTVHVIRAHEVEVVLSSSKNIEKSFIYDFLHPFMGTGLLTSAGLYSR
jgi:hypothetical protein